MTSLSNISLAAPSAPMPLASPLLQSQLDFSSVLARAAGKSKDKLDEKQAHEAAADFVAAAFIEPLLKTLRESNQAAPPFAPGTGEKQFRGLMDAQLARHISRGAHFPLVDRVARDLLGKPRELPLQYRLPATDRFPPAKGPTG